MVKMQALIESDNDIKPNRLIVYGKKSIRYCKVGLLLHCVSIVSLILFLWLLGPMISAFKQDQIVKGLCFGMICLISISLVFFSQMDAYSRFQDYKLVKDLIFENGFRTRVVKLFVGSRCQREALKMASIDLGMSMEQKLFFKQLGYKWFHIIPYIYFSYPFIFFSWAFWEKTLFARPYKSKYFLW